MRIILFLLKCLVGIFATIGFLLIAGLVGLSLLWDQIDPLRARVEPIPDTVVLTLDLAPGMIEVRPDNPLARASLSGVPTLRGTLDTLQAGAADPRVRGLLARVGRGGLGMAQSQELRQAVLDFRAAGKFALAFAESFGEGGNQTLSYYLASAFDRIWIQPSGHLNLAGFHIQSPYVREALDKIGVVPRLDQRGAYKGLMNNFTDRALPEVQRRNLQRLVDSWLEQVVAGVAAERELDEAAVRRLIDRAPHSAGEALDSGLVDRIGYWDEAEADAFNQADLAPGAGRDVFLALSQYASRREAPEPDGAVIALVYGLGPVVLDQSEDDPVFGSLTMGADTVARALRDAANDSDVHAIVFRVDSPGGSYVASDVIWREVRRAGDRDVPVIVTMGDIAASGGYFVAAPAHAIVAQPGTLTGSIGVVAGKAVLTGLWQSLGIRWDGVKAGAQADFWSPNRDFSDAEWARLQDFLDRTYEDFTRKVAEGRNLTHERVLSVAEGRLWSGADALEAGLVDALGGYRTAFALAREAAGLGADAPIQIRLFPAARDPVEALIEDVLAGELESPGLRSLARGLARVARALAPLIEVMEAVTTESTGTMLRAPALHDPAGAPSAF